MAVRRTRLVWAPCGTWSSAPRLRLVCAFRTDPEILEFITANPRYRPNGRSTAWLVTSLTLQSTCSRRGSPIVDHQASMVFDASAPVGTVGGSQPY